MDPQEDGITYEMPTTESTYYTNGQQKTYLQEWYKLSDKHKAVILSKWDKQEITGISVDEPIVTNDNGSSQSKVNYRFDLMTPEAMFELGKVLHEGAEKYGDTNWRGIPTNDHLNHALIHIYAFMSGDTQDEHLAHAFTRIMMAVTTDKDLERWR